MCIRDSRQNGLHEQQRAPADAAARSLSACDGGGRGAPQAVADKEAVDQARDARRPQEEQQKEELAKQGEPWEIKLPFDEIPEHEYSVYYHGGWGPSLTETRGKVQAS